MKLSIIIVNYNVKYFLEQCLNSILASNIAFSYEIIIVDNNSTDGSIEYLKSNFVQSNIYFIENKTNPGFSKANNQAIKRAKGMYILLLNPDTIVGENVLSNVCQFMDSETRSGAVGVKMIDGSGCFLPESKRGFPSPWASFCKIFGLAAIFPKSFFFGGYNLLYLDEDSMHQIPILAGAFMMIRKEALDKAGLLDEAFFMYGEDIDLSYRIQEAGYKNYYLPERIIHYKGKSTNKDDAKYTRAFYGAMQIFYNKYYPQNKLFYFFISVGIKTKIAIEQVAGKFKSLNKNTLTDNIVTFDKSDFSYEEIINQMDKSKSKNIQYKIGTIK
ncbi:GT2 family glycosyltransferase [Dysgonomonas alginatilytica]|uniref:GT2 family glycosyltransferase n=1 Tax=Dysgonomonas alginatilytica TaxID=1605892 RepID=A0A2V3PRY3_9BACT|nr:glycosyltransferase family 2 protein [Dysgonomonas alginatilytica]PXV64690.1 GT2 family glycosyltransferase [Dysgonomonas alginatilytica]